MNLKVPTQAPINRFFIYAKCKNTIITLHQKERGGASRPADDDDEATRRKKDAAHVSFDVKTSASRNRQLMLKNRYLYFFHFHNVLSNTKPIKQFSKLYNQAFIFYRCCCWLMNLNLFGLSFHSAEEKRKVKQRSLFCLKVCFTVCVRAQLSDYDLTVV